MSLITNEGNFLGINYDLAIYSDIARDERVFNLFPKIRYYEESGVDVFSENIKEFENKRIVLEPNTYDIELTFPQISNIKTLVIYGKVKELNSVYQPDFTVKLDSISANRILAREFTHMGISGGLSKIYLSNPNEYTIELNIFVAGDDTSTQFTPLNTYYKTNTNAIVEIKHNIGAIPEVICIKDDGTLFTDFTIEKDADTATLTFGSSFQGKIVFQHIYSFDCAGQTTFEIQHNLNKYPGLIMENPGNYSIVYNDADNLTITFENAYTGSVKLY